MAEPKKRMTSTRTGNRQSHDRLKTTGLIICSKCKSRIKPHRVCPNCGYYKGKKTVMDKKDLQIKKKKEEEIKDE